MRRAGVNPIVAASPMPVASPIGVASLSAVVNWAEATIPNDGTRRNATVSRSVAENPTVGSRRRIANRPTSRLGRTIGAIAGA
jgi:hypothetical protein